MQVSLTLAHLSSFPVVPGVPLFNTPAATFPAFPLSPIPVSVLFVKRMTVLAVGLSAIDRCHAMASNKKVPVGGQFKVFGVDAVVGATDVAQNLALGNLADRLLE